MEGSGDAEHGVRLIVAYDGTAFHGWQRQRNVRTVQAVLEEAITHLDPHHGKVFGASRTDAGVHALGQVVAFSTHRVLPPRGWIVQLNTLLPDDLSVRDAFPCAPDYDPRRDSLGKLYRYRLHVGATRDPLKRLCSWALRPMHTLHRAEGPVVEACLDLDAMRRAAAQLIGTHDFHAFRAADDPRENSVRTMRAVRLLPGFGGEPEALAIEVEGNAFMKHMVRILVGTLVEIGGGRRAEDSIARLLEKGAQREHAGLTAPAHGLVLVRVDLGRIAASGAASPEPA